MDRKELEQKTVAELREIAKGLPEAKGLSSMKKDELIEFIASHNGDSTAPAPGAKPPKAAKPEMPAATGKSAIKQRIRALRTQKEEALSKQDSRGAKACNREIRRCKRLLRKLARGA